MGSQLPSPVATGDFFAAAIVERLDTLIQLVNDRLPAPDGGQPAPAGEEGNTVRLDLTEPAQPGHAGTAEASTPDSSGVPLSEPKPRKTARKRAPAKEK